MSMIQSFQEIALRARALPARSCVALACAHDLHSLQALADARRDGIADGILIGKEPKIREILNQLGEDAGDYEIVPCADPAESVRIAADFVHRGNAGVIMKGRMETAEIIRGILDRDNSLRTDSRLSVTGLFETKAYHKIFGITDVAITPYPDLQMKKNIITNATTLFHALGQENPKVAVLAAVEKAIPKMKETMDASQLKQMGLSGEITSCVIEGPVSFDLAISSEAANLKGYHSSVAGDADIFVVPDLVCGNVLAKGLTCLAGAVTAGIVLGAKVPIVLVSRAATAEDKYYSIATAACTAPFFRQKYQMQGEL